jgi:hypothetical protein
VPAAPACSVTQSFEGAPCLLGTPLGCLGRTACSLGAALLGPQLLNRRHLFGLASGEMGFELGDGLAEAPALVASRCRPLLRLDRLPGRRYRLGLGPPQDLFGRLLPEAPALVIAATRASSATSTSRRRRPNA